MATTVIDENVVLIRPTRIYDKSMTPLQLLEATRGVWRIGPRREKAEYAFSVVKGIVIEVYRVKRWLPAGTLEYITRPRSDIEVAGRWEFDGELAEESIRSKYRSASVKGYLPQGAASPVIYVNC